METAAGGTRTHVQEQPAYRSGGAEMRASLRQSARTARPSSSRSPPLPAVTLVACLLGTQTGARRKAVCQLWGEVGRSSQGGRRCAPRQGPVVLSSRADIGVAHAKPRERQLRPRRRTVRRYSAGTDRMP